MDPAAPLCSVHALLLSKIFSRDDSKPTLSNQTERSKEGQSMSNYSYEAVDAGGLKIEGKLDVIDQNEALRRVKEMGLFPVRIVAMRELRQKQKLIQPKAVGGRKQIVINIPYFSGRVKASVLA